MPGVRAAGYSAMRRSVFFDAGLRKQHNMPK